MKRGNLLLELAAGLFIAANWKFISGCLSVMLVVGFLMVLWQQAPWAFVIFVGLIVTALWVGFNGTRKRAAIGRVAVGTAPFGENIPDAIIPFVTSSPVLFGDERYSQRVVHTEKFLDNWRELLKVTESRDGTTLTNHTAELTCEPGNAENPQAVSVSFGSAILGYLPRTDSGLYFPLIMANGGVVRAKAKYKFNVAKNANDVWLDVRLPVRIMTAAELKALGLRQLG